ncbi:MAG TPA: PP2C family protein-serine/threonine phosphatase [Cytophagaceae bacterium]|jgi:sigma-B regulation protein RsbU (phosphoserine phosphatase)
MTHKQLSNGNVVNEHAAHKLYVKQLELNSLLEITQAINSNLPEASLYKIFHFTILGNLNVKKLALYVLDSNWECKVNYGTKDNFKNKPLHKKILKCTTVCFPGKELQEYDEFSVIIPVAHKSNVLAYILAGGFEDSENLKDNSVISFLQTISSIIIVAVENKKLVRRELLQEAFKKELEIAREVQAMLFPKELPFNDNLKIVASYLPHLSIGGDYYDYMPIDADNFLICVGDVSGKGIPAALLMSNFQACLRTLVRQTCNLKEIVTELNYGILNNAKGERFITFFVAIINTKNKTINYINAGHNPIFLVPANGKCQLLEKGTTVLGAFKDLPFLEDETLTYGENTLIFAYTDGLTETCNDKNEEFGMERLEKILRAKSRFEISKLHSGLLKKLDTHKGAQNYADDITCLSCLIN